MEPSTQQNTDGDDDDETMIVIMRAIIILRYREKEGWERRNEREGARDVKGKGGDRNVR